MSPEPSRQVVQLFVDGDIAAFREIYELTRDYVFAAVYRMVMNREETEDLTHDIYIRVFDKRKTFRGSVRFTTWIYRIAVNHTINHLRRKQSFAQKLYLFSSETPLFELSSDENDSDNDNDTKRIIEAALQQVRPEYRICLIMRDVQGSTYEAIARKLNLRIGTVRSRINRGRKQLLKAYKKEVQRHEM